MPKFVCEAFASPEQLLAAVCEGQLDPEDDLEAIQEALDDAADTLFVLSGHRFWGICRVTLRPCRDSCLGSYCGCCALDAIPLSLDLHGIVSVKIDGVTLATNTYRSWTGPDGIPSLVKVSTDGERPSSWPGCQKLYRASTEEDTFEVIIDTGMEPGLTERNANIELALHLLGKKLGGSIEVLSGVDGISGGGVSISVDPEDSDRGVGLPAVATFVSTWNPDRNRTSSGVFAPEIGAW